MRTRFLAIILTALMLLTNAFSQTEGAKSQQEAAQKLIDAWKANNRSAAAKFAAPAAVKKLFQLKVYSSEDQHKPEVRCENEKPVKCFYGFMDEQGFSVQMSFAKRNKTFYVSRVETFVD